MTEDELMGRTLKLCKLLASISQAAVADLSPDDAGDVLQHVLCSLYVSAMRKMGCSREHTIAGINMCFDGAEGKLHGDEDGAEQSV